VDSAEPFFLRSDWLIYTQIQSEHSYSTVGLSAVFALYLRICCCNLLDPFYIWTKDFRRGIDSADSWP